MMVFDIPVNIHGVGGGLFRRQANSSSELRYPLTKPCGALVSRTAELDYGEMIMNRL